MKLSRAINLYVDSKHAVGLRFKTGAECLRDFLRKVGDIEIRTLTDSQVETFLVAPRRSERTWARKYTILKHFFRFWILRGRLEESHLPRPRVICRAVMPPRVFTRQEVRRILRAAATLPEPWGTLVDSRTVRTFMLLVYGTGAQLCEGVSMLCSNVDLKRGLLTLNRPPTSLSRTIPIEGTLLLALRKYEREVCHVRSPGVQTFFVNKAGFSIRPASMMRRFARARDIARIRKNEGATFSPRLYDLRHTFAVHTLIRWLAQGHNLRAMLPRLSVYLGHFHWEETEKYLSLIPGRFEKQLAKLQTPAS
jgi:site-specific recombinase XerD